MYGEVIMSKDRILSKQEKKLKRRIMILENFLLIVGITETTLIVLLLWIFEVI